VDDDRTCQVVVVAGFVRIDDLAIDRCIPTVHIRQVQFVLRLLQKLLDDLVLLDRLTTPNTIQRRQTLRLYDASRNNAAGLC
jgi:hypothetical protein